LDGDADTFWTATDAHSGEMEVRFAQPVTFDRSMTMEWLNDGQRVEKYAIDAWVNGSWKTVASSQAIGHKKIDEFAAVTASRVRLRIVSSTGPAMIREFQLFSADREKRVGSAADRH
jgi:alpha-L-fucosidase